MRRSLHLIACSLLAIGAPGPLYSFTDYYVATTGDDGAGDGSAGNPWRTITHALSVSTTGDTVNVAAGTYNSAGGEVFPLEIEEEALVGAGRDATSIEGGEDSVLVRMRSEFPEAAMLQGFELRHLDLAATASLPIIANGPNPFPGLALGIVRNNRFIGGATAIAFNSGGVGGLSISSNEALDTDAVQAGDFLIANGGNRAVQVRKNSIEGFDRGIAAMTRDVLTIASNQIVLPASTAIVLEPTFGGPERVIVERNEISSAGGDAIRARFFVISLDLEIGGALRHNSIMNCGGSGIDIALTASVSSSSSSSAVQPGRLSFDVRVEGNLILDNGGHGLALHAAAFDGLADAEVRIPSAGNVQHFRFAGPGPGPATAQTDVITGNGRRTVSPPPSSPKRGGDYRGFAGRNMIKRNAFWQVEIDGAGSGDLPAVFLLRGNWWGTQSPETVADRIVDVVDDPLLQIAADARELLAGQMKVRMLPKTATSGGGTAFEIEALPGAAFVEAIGLSPISVTLDGVPVQNLKVNGNGLRLTFDAPALPVGNANLRIDNPNGTWASKTVQIVP